MLLGTEKEFGDTEELLWLGVVQAVLDIPRFAAFPKAEEPGAESTGLWASVRAEGPLHRFRVEEWW